MENKKRKKNNMKNVFLIFTLLFICNVCLPNKLIQKDTLIFEIHFKDFFKNDTLSLHISELTVFENKILTSDSILGFSNVIIQGRYNNGKCTIIYNEKEVSIEKIDTSFNLVLNINGKEQLFYIDLKKGSYIGFDKKSKNMNFIVISQSKIKFEYD